jgi:hypothetical protein
MMKQKWLPATILKLILPATAPAMKRKIINEDFEMDI